MFQKKVTIKDNIVNVKVSNEVGEMDISIVNDAPYHIIKKTVFENIKVTYKVDSTKEIENYWEPQFKLIMNEIINSIYSIGLKNINPEKNFADYDLIREE